ALALRAAHPVAALARAYDRLHQRVRVLARRLLADDAAAEDVVQEVFVSLPRAARGFRGDSAFDTFVLGMAVRRAQHHLRGAIRRRRALDRLERATAAAPGLSEPPDDVACR